MQLSYNEWYFNSFYSPETVQENILISKKAATSFENDKITKYSSILLAVFKLKRERFFTSRFFIEPFIQVNFILSLAEVIPHYVVFVRKKTWCDSGEFYFASVNK